jgi:hypothetical protein
MKRLGFVLLLLILCISRPVFAQLILSEILANEPGNRTLLEWIEIYNNNADSINIEQFHLVVNGDTLDLPDSTFIASYSYMVLCRRLLPRLGSDCFEYHWGDSSGVWGNDSSENYLAIELPISLPNSSGHIQLLDSNIVVIDECEWHSACADGQSLERDDVTDYFSGWHPCADSLGSTPGQPNSHEPVEPSNYSFEITPKAIRLSDNSMPFTITYTVPEGTAISLVIYDDSARKRVTILDEQVASEGTVVWRGTDNNGNALSPGLYFLTAKISGSWNQQKTIPLAISP